MKSDVAFALENAGWPALLVDGAAPSAVRNPAATNLFGAALAGESPRLSAVWSPENTQHRRPVFGPVGALRRPDTAAQVPGQGRPVGWLSHVDLRASPRTAQKYFVLQLLRETTRRRGGSETAGRGRRPGTQAEAGLRAATGAHRGAGFQQCADQHPRPHVARPEQDGAEPSLAQLADRGREIGRQGGRDRQRPGHLQPPGKGGPRPGRRQSESAPAAQRGVLPAERRAGPGGRGRCSWTASSSRPSSTKPRCSRRS